MSPQSPAASTTPRDSAPEATETRTSESTAPVFPTWIRPNLKVIAILFALALASRLAWALWLHPPGNYVFSDMGQYIRRANLLLNEGFTWGRRPLAWQSFGTHYLIALIFKIFGNKAPYVPVAVSYAFFSAVAVPLAYVLACRVLPRH
ncbi:MAG TPA: hypothetical protein ENJ18_10345, partial [Nannocystis exedens]|nr:hypothetical protein [Nannocystis exedens]